jgi:4-hydroxyproline epimerase
MQRIQVIDTHTAGEPTRVIVAGGPELGPVTPAQARERLRVGHDGFRAAVATEPRGSDVLVAALLLPPTDPECCAGVVFMNNVGYLNMCGHGTIGVAVALGHLGRIKAGTHRLQTPVGVVSFRYDGANRVSLENVPSYRLATDVFVEVPGIGPVTGDIAWGGNWFFLIDRHSLTLTLEHLDVLTDFTWRVRQALHSSGINGEHGAEIDHIELTGPALDPANHSRNFVLCPGKAYDRSPCGTGTSAKLACLYADGKLKPGDIWRQESVIGSVFSGTVSVVDDQIIPCITGDAYVTAGATLLLDPKDPFKMGIPR